MDGLLDRFFYQPMAHFGVRQLSRETKLDSKTVMKYLKKAVSDKLVVKRIKKGHFTYYEANRLSPIYKFEKSHTLMREIIKSGLIEHLNTQLEPRAIVLFGSVAKGTYYLKSDIDLFIQSKCIKIDLFKFEKRLKHKINLFFENNTKRLSKGLKENIYNGITLTGKLDV